MTHAAAKKNTCWCHTCWQSDSAFFIGDTSTTHWVTGFVYSHITYQHTRNIMAYSRYVRALLALVDLVALVALLPADNSRKHKTRDVMIIRAIKKCAR
jgi:hypothetical protein